VAPKAVCGASHRCQISAARFCFEPARRTRPPALGRRGSLFLLQLVPLELPVLLVAGPVLEELQEGRGADLDLLVVLPDINLALEAVEVELGDDLPDRDRVLLASDPLHHLSAD
jgi:hypothetical protein